MCVYMYVCMCGVYVYVCVRVCCVLVCVPAKKMHLTKHNPGCNFYHPSHQYAHAKPSVQPISDPQNPQIDHLPAPSRQA